MAAPASELGWVVHFAPVVRFTPLPPTWILTGCVKFTDNIAEKENRDAGYLERSWWHRCSTLGSDYTLLDTNIGKRTTGPQWDEVALAKTVLCQKVDTLPLNHSILSVKKEKKDSRRPEITFHSPAKILDDCQLWSRIFSQRGNWGCFDWCCDIFIWPSPNLAISRWVKSRDTVTGLGCKHLRFLLIKH